MYNKYIAIITAENKEKFISHTIYNCLRLLGSNLKIIVVYTNLSNEIILRNKFKEHRNVIFFKVKIKKNYPTQDQLYKIERSLIFVKNEWVLLLDGDDLFKLNKIKTLDKLKLDKRIVYLHNHEKKIEKYKKIYNNQNYKKNIIYKKLLNDWPKNIITSSIVINGFLLNKFFKNNKPYKWKFLAVDVQLILYFFYKNKFKYIDKILTTKNENINNLDKSFSNKNKKIFWLRRMEQHNFTKELSGKINLLDRFITFIFLKFLKL